MLILKKDFPKKYINLFYKKDLVEQNKDVFILIELFKDYECHIYINKYITPTIKAPRFIPIAIRVKELITKLMENPVRLVSLL